MLPKCRGKWRTSPSLLAWGHQSHTQLPPSMPLRVASHGIHREHSTAAMALAGLLEGQAIRRLVWTLMARWQVTIGLAVWAQRLRG